MLANEIFSQKVTLASTSYLAHKDRPSFPAKENELSKGKHQIPLIKWHQAVTAELVRILEAQFMRHEFLYGKEALHSGARRHKSASGSNEKHERKM